MPAKKHLIHFSFELLLLGSKRLQGPHLTQIPSTCTQCGATLGNGKQNTLVSCLVYLNDLVHLCVQGTYFKFIWWNVIGQKLLHDHFDANSGKLEGTHPWPTNNSLQTTQEYKRPTPSGKTEPTTLPSSLPPTPTNAINTRCNNCCKCCHEMVTCIAWERNGSSGFSKQTERIRTFQNLGVGMEEMLHHWRAWVIQQMAYNACHPSLQGQKNHWVPATVALQGGTSVVCGRAGEVRSFPLHGRSSQVSQKFVGYQILCLRRRSQVTQQWVNFPLKKQCRQSCWYPSCFDSWSNYTM